MREYVLHQSERRNQAAGLWLLWIYLLNWRSRRAFARLNQLNDYQLHDIGLSRADAHRLSRLPLSVDPVWEAERLRLLSSRQAN